MQEMVFVGNSLKDEPYTTADAIAQYAEVQRGTVDRLMVQNENRETAAYQAAARGNRCECTSCMLGLFGNRRNPGNLAADGKNCFQCVLSGHGRSMDAI